MRRKMEIELLIMIIFLVEIIFLIKYLLQSRCVCLGATVECKTCYYQFPAAFWTFSILAIITFIIFLLFRKFYKIKEK